MMRIGLLELVLRFLRETIIVQEKKFLPSAPLVMRVIPFLR